MFPKKVTSFFVRRYISVFNKKRVIPLDEFQGDIYRILVISNTALGDTIMSTPAVKSIKMSFPRAKIVCLIHRNYVDLFSNMSIIDKIIPYYGGYKRFFSTITHIKEEKYDACLILHGNSPQDIEIALLSGAKIILKSKPNRDSMAYLSYVQKELPIHAIRKRLLLVKLMGGEKFTEKMEIGELNNKTFLKRAERSISNREGIIIGFQLGASHWSRAWPPEYFSNLAELISQNFEKFKIVLFGNKNEQKLADLFFKHVKKYFCEKIIDLTGKLSIAELPYYLKRLDLLVTPDTGPLHLAIALKVPTVSLFALSKPEDTGPIQDLEIHKVIFKPEGLKYLKKKRKDNTNEAMKLITPKEVMYAIEEIIQRRVSCV
ncbi:glycosyltransferase family 9 protein [Thermodesulfatator atlanticus]|uniref:glycosyltransferase family 9 protein n=1 Tax=Thermodesulfatator atlanticus TaxID=501497 RepID=UPI0003B6ACB3|nr:glycosyltransferase family 9 protein [Thermodesulfatator atlanticus]